MTDMDKETEAALREWQPIETAPKDGTWILGYQHRSEIQDTVQLWAWGAFNSGCEFWINAIDHNDSDDQPTHWMPLSTPPEAEA